MVSNEKIGRDKKVVKTIPNKLQLQDDLGIGAPLSELEIIDSMRMIWERMKIIVEPSSSIALAALIKNMDMFNDKKVGLILSGGNVDLDDLPW